MTQSGVQNAAALLCFGRLIGWAMQRIARPGATAGLGLRPFRPQSTMYGVWVGYQALSFVVGLVFSTMSPLIAPVVLIHFVTGYVVARFKLFYTNIRSCALLVSRVNPRLRPAPSCQ